MANPMRLDSTLVEAAKREAALQKRSIPKQIEFWAELGKAVERVIGMEEVVAITQGLKKLKLENVDSSSAKPDDVFDSLEQIRASGSLSGNVSAAVVYYEASTQRPGLLDKVNTASGERQTGHFRNGKFMVSE